MSNIGDDNNNMLESCSSTSGIRRSSSIWTSGTRKSQVSLQHQKENHQNQQQRHQQGQSLLIPQRQIPPESINSNATSCGTMSKEQSLSSIRDVGCTNPMAYTLWHHSTVDTNMSDAERNVENDEHWIIHENWELLNSIDTTYYDKLSKEIDAFAIVDSEHTIDNDVYRYGEQHPNDDNTDSENNHNVVPSLFVPVNMTRQSNIADIIDDNHFNNINDNVDLPVSNRMTAINLIHDHNNNNNNDTVHHHHRRRRHTVSGYNITKPIAIRPMTTSATSLSINTIPK